MIRDLTERTRLILKLVVDAYLETGAPVGSLALSQKKGISLSPASIRAAMAELEERGLLYSPHTSAGRLPTETGLTLFVEGLLEVDALSPADEGRMAREISAARGGSVPELLEQASTALSGLTGGAGLVFAPKTDDPVKHIEFVLLSPGRALAVIVTASGMVENRLMDVPADTTATSLLRAANYLNARMAEKTLAQAAEHVRTEMAQDRAQLDALSARLVEAGLASLGPAEAGGHLFVRGQANLLGDVTAIEDIDRVQRLFEALETKETMLRLLGEAAAGEGVKIFIGAENKLFSHSGCALVIAPYRGKDARLMGAIGVIGPARLNYGRVIPVVNYASLLVGRIVG